MKIRRRDGKREQNTIFSFGLCVQVHQKKIKNKKWMILFNRVKTGKKPRMLQKSLKDEDCPLEQVVKSSLHHKFIRM